MKKPGRNLSPPGLTKHMKRNTKVHPVGFDEKKQPDYAAASQNRGESADARKPEFKDGSSRGSPLCTTSTPSSIFCSLRPLHKVLLARTETKACANPKADTKENEVSSPRPLSVCNQEIIRSNQCAKCLTDEGTATKKYLEPTFHGIHRDSLQYDDTKKSRSQLRRSSMSSIRLIMLPPEFDTNETLPPETSNESCQSQHLVELMRLETTCSGCQQDKPLWHVISRKKRHGLSGYTIENNYRTQHMFIVS